MSDDTPALTRRKVLGSLGVMGGAAALSGAGTMAGFTDAEEKIGWLTTGEVDLLMDYRSTYVPWERFDLNPDDPLTDGDYSNSEAVPVDGDDMTYVVGQAPDFRVDENDDGDVQADSPAVSGEDWAALTRTLDACQFPNSTDITEDDGDLAVNGTNVAVYGSPGVMDTYETGYVDGFTGMQVSLTDIKPLDHGESTISLHVCGNPSFLTFSFDYEVDQATSDLEVGTTNDPEFESGDKNNGNGKYSEFGELDDFMWVRLWQDANCNNIYDEGEVILYEGSLKGLFETTSDGIQLNPLQLLDLDGDGTNGTATDLPLTEDLMVILGGNPMCDNLHDITVDEETLGEKGYSFSEHLSLDESELPDVGSSMTVDGVTINRTEDGCLTYTTDGSVDICAVIMKGGGGPNLPAGAAKVYVGESSISLEGDELCTVVPGNSTEPANISHVDFCTCEVDNGEIPPQEVPLCIDDACVAYEWFLPQELTQPDGMGFAELPSDISGTTLAQEIVDRFGLPTENQIDVNAVQTDAVHYKTEFVAEQCRHHLGGTNGVV